VKYIELFAGIGGMGYGLMQAGMECVGYCEIDKYAHKAFQLLHDPEERMWNAYDVRSVTDDDLRLLGRERGPIDLIAGGFPCQSFSIAGKRQGFTDTTRGTLFFEIVRFASILRPKHLLLENVTGLLNHDGGATFETVIGTLDELGYVGEWCVLNSAAYVPQNRERIFIVASLRGHSGRKIFPFGGENSNAVEVVGKLDIKGDDYIKRVYSPEGIRPCLPTMQGGMQEPKVLITKQNDQLQIRSIATCLDANYFKGLDCHQQRTGVMEITCINPRKEDGTQTYQQDRVYDTDGVMTALSAQLAGRFNIRDGYRIRKLTPLECMRLQSFPDEWYYTLKKAGISDSQLYKMAGNAVTSRVAYEIGRRLVG
jgi:DNA (cytosine-5)-methyltransferase 1